LVNVTGKGNQNKNADPEWEGMEINEREWESKVQNPNPANPQSTFD